MQTYESQRDVERKLSVTDLKEKLEKIALTKIVRDGSLYGYEFLKYIKREFGVLLSPSDLYESKLHSLERRGIIRSELKTVNGRTRRIYHPVTLRTEKYLEMLRNVDNRNRAKLNKISRKALNVELLEPTQVA